MKNKISIHKEIHSNCYITKVDSNCYTIVEIGLTSRPHDTKLNALNNAKLV